MEFYKHLYIGEGLEKKIDKIRRKLEAGKLQPPLQLITLAQNPQNHLEIFESVLLLQPSYPKEEQFVVGITKSYEEALEFVEKLVQNVYNETKSTDVRSYILKKEQES